MVNIVRGCILGICFFGSYAVGVRANDSLKRLLGQSSGKERIQQLNQLAEIYILQAPAQSLTYSKQAYTLAVQWDDPNGQALAKTHIATYYLYTGRYTQAEQHLKQAMQLAQLQKSSLLQVRILTRFASLSHVRGKYTEAQQYALCALVIQKKLRTLPQTDIAALKSLLGCIYTERGLPEKGLAYTLQALELRKELNNPSEIAHSLNQLGDFYFSQHNLRKALYNYLESLRIARQRNNQHSMSVSLDHIGQVYLVQRRFQEALLYFKEALAISQELDIPALTARIYMHMGEANQDLRVFEQALQYYATSLRIYLNLQNDLAMATVLNKIGNMYAAQKEYRTALSYHFQALHKVETSESKVRKIHAYKSLADTYLQMNDSPHFMHYYHQYAQLQDSVQHEIQQNVMYELQNRLEQQEKEMTATREKKWQQAELEKERSQHLYLLIIVVVGTILGITLVAFYITRLQASRKLKRQNSIITQRNRQLHRVNATLKALNDKLMASDIELRKTNEAKDKFFSIIAHDLRAPLATFSSFLTALSDNSGSFTSDEIDFITRSTQKSLKNLTALLNNLLQWSRSQMGQIQFRPQPLVVKELAVQTLGLFTEDSRNKGISLTEDVSPDAVAFADANMIDFVVRNLVSNAIKFTSRGGTIRVYSLPTNVPDQLEICIEDTGVGIPPENLVKLFNLRTGFTTTGTANEKGTGLGLVLCREFVEKNGGTIRVESEPGKGTRFLFTLPTHKTDR